MDIETPDPKRFRASATVHNFDAMRLIAFDLGPMSISRTADLLRDGDDDFSLVLCTSGAGHAVGPDGDGAPLSSGRAVLIPHYVQGGTVACGDNTELSLVVPRESSRQAIRDPDAAAGRMPSNPAAPGLLASYLALFTERREGMDRPLADLVEGHVLDLLSLAFDPDGDFARAGGHGGARTAMRQRLAAVVDAPGNPLTQSLCLCLLFEGGSHVCQSPWHSSAELTMNMLTLANCVTESSASAFVSPAVSSVSIATR